MNVRGSRVVLTLAGACWLMTGCATRPQNNSDHGLTAAARLRVAEASEATGDHQTAASMFLAAANDAPGDTAVQLRSAEGLVRNNRLDGAETILQHRLELDPKQPDLLRTLGAVQVMAGEPLRAVQNLSHALAAKPEDIKALVDKAVALDMLRRHTEAQILYRKALAQSPDDLAASNNLALSLLLSGRPSEAHGVLAPFGATVGLPERIKINLGIIDAATGRPADAQALLGSRIDAASLAKLTQAIGQMATEDGGQP